MPRGSFVRLLTNLEANAKEGKRHWRESVYASAQVLDTKDNETERKHICSLDCCRVFFSAALCHDAPSPPPPLLCSVITYCKPRSISFPQKLSGTISDLLSSSQTQGSSSKSFVKKSRLLKSSASFSNVLLSNEGRRHLFENSLSHFHR